MSSHLLICHQRPRPHGHPSLQDREPVIHQGLGMCGFHLHEGCNAYLHMPMHGAVRKFLRFMVNKKAYQLTGLPFSLSTSPRELTKLLRPVVLLLQRSRRQATHLLGWLVDPHRFSRAVCPDDHQVSSTPRMEKSELEPSQDFQFIGMHFKTRQFTVAPLPKMDPRSSQFTSIGLPIPASQLEISADCWACWCSWQLLFHGAVFGFNQFSGGCPRLVPEDRELV